MLHVSVWVCVSLRGLNTCVKEWVCKPLCTSVEDVLIGSASMHLPSTRPF